MPIAASDAAMGEMLAVLLARDMADGEKAIVGTNSDIQVAACNLARQRQAPHLWWVSGPGGMTNPSDGVIRPAADAENIAVAEAVMDLPQMIDFIDWQVHFFDFAILGALQADRFGNINTVCIGDHARPKLRGPGTVGISALCGLSRRFYIMMTRHDRGAFVPKVDFICGAGHLDGGTSRTDRGLPEGGPKLVVTPLGVFDFEPHEQGDADQVAARGRHAGRGARQHRLRSRSRPPTIERTVAPSAEELFVLRRLVDTTGVLARKFPWPASRSAEAKVAR